MPAAAADDEQQGSALRIAFPEHGCKIACGFGPAQDACNFEMRRKPVAAQGARDSGGVAFIRPHEHGSKGVATARTTHLLEGGRMAGHPADRG